MEDIKGYSVGYAGPYVAIALDGTAKQRRQLLGVALAIVRILDSGTYKHWDPGKRHGKWHDAADRFREIFKDAEAAYLRTSCPVVKRG